MTLTEKLDYLMRKKGINRREFSSQSGIPYMTIVNFYEKGTENVKLSTLKKIATFFNVSLDYIADDTISDCNYGMKNNYQVTSIEHETIKKYRELDIHGRKIVDFVLDEEYRRVTLKPNESEGEKEEDSFPDNVIELNFSEQPSSAGTGYWLDEEQMIKKKVMLNRDTAKADFCVPVSGDSMTPQFNDGDILLVRKQPAVDIGQIGIFTIDGTGFVKKFGIGQLESLNSKYEPIPINEDTDLICNGKVLGVLNPEWIVED